MKRRTLSSMAFLIAISLITITTLAGPPLRNDDPVIVTMHVIDEFGNIPNADTPADTPLYTSRCLPLMVPLEAPDGHHITWGEFSGVTGRVAIKCVNGQTHVTIHLSGLVPNHTYTIWYVSFWPSFRGSPVINRVGFGSLGPGDGSGNQIVSSASGEGQLSVMVPAGPLAIGEVGECLLDHLMLPEAPEIHLVGAYHLDQETHGPLPGNPCTWVAQFGFIFTK